MIENDIASRQNEIDNAIVNYANALSVLRKLTKYYPSSLPSGVVGIGLIAEHDVRRYLDVKHMGARVQFGCATQKGWDIEVILSEGGGVKYQVKSIGPSNKNRKITSITRGFDKLIVISLGDAFVPERAYLFDDARRFFDSHKGSLIVPKIGSGRRTGSQVFHLGLAIDITDDILAVLE